MRRPEDFNLAMGELRAAVSEAMEPLLEEEKGSLLKELIEVQLDGVEKFYELLLSEMDGKVLIDAICLDLIAEKHRRVYRHFKDLPGSTDKSTYKRSIATDVFQILRHHTRDAGHNGSLVKDRS
jgi:hypothetical protein